MKRKLLSILLTFCLAFSLLPTTALAVEGEASGQTNCVAQIGETKYTTLAEAVEKAATGATITLLKEVELEVVMGTSGKLVPQMTVSGKQITLDLAGYTIK